MKWFPTYLFVTSLWPDCWPDCNLIADLIVDLIVTWLFTRLWPYCDISDMIVAFVTIFVTWLRYLWQDMTIELTPYLWHACDWQFVTTYRQKIIYSMRFVASSSSILNRTKWPLRRFRWPSHDTPNTSTFYIRHST